MSFLLPFIQDRPQISNIPEEAREEIPEETSQQEVNQELNEILHDEAGPSTPSSVKTNSSVSATPSTSSATRKRKVGAVPTAAEVLDKYLKRKSENKTNSDTNSSLHNFFLSMEQTVKTFPQKVQTDIKSKIFRIVNAAEMELLCNNERRNDTFTAASQHLQPLSTEIPEYGEDALPHFRRLDNSEYTEYTSGYFQNL